MKIKMKATIEASANKEGSVSMIYKSGEVYDMTDKMNIATLLLNVLIVHDHVTIKQIFGIILTVIAVILLST